MPSVDVDPDHEYRRTLRHVAEVPTDKGRRRAITQNRSLTAPLCSSCGGVGRPELVRLAPSRTYWFMLCAECDALPDATIYERYDERLSIGSEWIARINEANRRRAALVAEREPGESPAAYWARAVDARADAFRLVPVPD